MSKTISAAVLPADRSFPRGWLVPVGLGRWLLLCTAVLQAVSPSLTSFGGSDRDPPVVPAGYPFSIWSVVIAGCLGAAMIGFPRRRAASPAFRAVHLRLSVVQVLFCAWLVAATSSALWLTVPIFATMLALTLVGLRRVLSAGRVGAPDGDSRPGRTNDGRLALGLLGGTLGIYAGWSTAGVWINVASLAAQGGLSPAGAVGTAWQSLVLIGACAVAVWAVRALAAPLPYVAAVAWAFVGVVVSAVSAELPGLAAVAVLGLIVVAAAAALSWRRPPPRPGTPCGLVAPSR